MEIELEHIVERETFWEWVNVTKDYRRGIVSAAAVRMSYETYNRAWNRRYAAGLKRWNVG